MNEITEEQVKEVVKKKKNRGAPPPTPMQLMDEFASQDERAAYNARTLTDMVPFLKAKPVKSTEEAIERTEGYFLGCARRGVRPTWEEYGLAMGVSRVTLWSWATGQKNPPFDANVVRQAKEFIAAYDARMVTDGKLNPVTYIFRAKNYYDMKDQQDVVVTPNTIETRPAKELIAEAEMLPDD